MSDLIKRRDAINIVVSALNAEIPFTIVPDLMQAIPSSDSINHIQCKDCKYWHSNTEFCGIWSWSSQNIAQRTLSDDYCSRAERREE